MSPNTLDKILDLKTFPFLNNQLGKQLPFRKSIRVLHIFGAGGQNALFLTNKDVCYVVGNNRYGCLAMGDDKPYEITVKTNPNLSRKGLIDICNGTEHCLGLTSSGKCYSWGSNQKGQLGQNNKQLSYSPLLVANLSDKKVIQISCGEYHSMALTAEGKVYSWGLNKFGQLGRSHSNDISIPTFINIENPIASISCGRNHSIALANSGILYTWGHNQFGQLGRHFPDHTNSPKALPYQFNTINIFKAICGADYSLLLTTDGFIYGFGCNKSGQIGNNTTESQFLPIKIKEEIRFKDVITNLRNNLSVGVSTDGKYYVWGLANGVDVLSPKLVSETSKESVFNVYAKFAKTKITFKTIVLNNDNNKQLIVCSAQPKTEDNSCSSDISEESNDKELAESPTISSEQLSQHSIVGDNHSIRSSSLSSIALNNINNNIIKSFNNPKNSDLMFTTEDKIIYCHKTILQIRCEKIWEIISKQINNTNVVKISGETYEAFYAFLQYLYGIEPEFNDKIIYDLKSMAEVFDEKDLLDECLQYIDVMESTPNLSNVCSLYEKCINEGSTDLEKSCIEFAANNWKTILTSKEFSSLNEILSKRLIVSVFKIKI